MSLRHGLGCAALLALGACVAPSGRAPPPPPLSDTGGGRQRPLAVSSRPPGPARPAARAIVPPLPAALGRPAAGATALAQGLRAGPSVAALGITEGEARSALSAFALSCGELLRRTDASGLTRHADWQPACGAAPGWPADDAGGFFARYFQAVTVGDGAAYATGYYEPEIAGAREHRAGYDVPIYRRPPDLVDVDLGLFAPDLKGRKIRGQVQGGKLGLYPDRAAIVGGTLAGRGLELAWGADPIEVFFLQVQGSGLIRLPDGGIMRVGYDTQNGRDYAGIGRLMRDRGMFAAGQSQSMQGVMARLRQEPDGGAAIMNENRSFVFFREIGGDGPIGALGLPVTGRTTVAADPAFVPLGAPIFLALDRYEASGLWIAQDTGGAIKGPNRVDTYWGSGAEARQVAGGMSARGAAWLLLPVGVLARIGGVARLPFAPLDGSPDATLGDGAPSARP